MKSFKPEKGPGKNYFRLTKTVSFSPILKWAPRLLFTNNKDTPPHVTAQQFEKWREVDYASVCARAVSCHFWNILEE